MLESNPHLNKRHIFVMLNFCILSYNNNLFEKGETLV